MRFVKITIMLAISILILSGVNPEKNKITLASQDVQERLENAVLLYVGSPVARVKNSERMIDPDNPLVTPVIYENRTLVPVRFICESLGASVEWREESSEAVITLDGTEYKLAAGSTVMTAGPKEYALDVPARIVNDRMYIPLRKLSEAIGKKIFYERGLIAISDIDDIFDKLSEKNVIDELIARVNNLPAVGSYEKLKELLAKANQSSMRTGGTKEALTATSAVNGAAMKSADGSAQAVADSAAGGGSADYSATNVQVAGVDEADVVKTDGQYLYQVSGQKIVIAKGYPAENMEIVSTVQYPDNSFMPNEIYIDGDRLTVIGSSSGLGGQVNGIAPVYDTKMAIYPGNMGSVKAIVYDISDRAKVKQLREVEVEGNYISSRKVDSAVYIVSNRWINYYTLKDNPESAQPMYRDTAFGEEKLKLDYNDIRYFPDVIESQYLLVTGFDINKPEEKARIEAYLGAGQNIYASRDNLYIAVTHYDRNTGIQPMASVIGIRTTQTPADTATMIYKFLLDGGKAAYLCKGEVPGTILNQFSMDENGRNFRIATTRGDMWRNDEYTSKNNVYILDEMLSITGKLEDIAPGERIYSVRFMGDRAYMVTFKKVDPLFVLDLKDASNPKVLGALKIPGYSDYLHPYDENHIIGFGKDTVEISQKDMTGKDYGSMAFYQGMKIAMFDVSDVANPKQEFSEIIGDRGTDSELLRNHKALLFSKEKGLMAFPVTVMKVRSGQTSGVSQAMPAYGEFEFQGVYVYKIDPDKGFVLKGRITHMQDSDYLKAGKYWYNSDVNVQRALYIDDTLYTFSNSMIKANNIESMKELKSVPIQ